MLDLSPSALRLIALALRGVDDAGHSDEWLRWASGSRRSIEPHTAQIAVNALSHYALRLEDDLRRTEDSSEAARIENDLAYVGDLEADLAELVRPQDLRDVA